MKLTLSDLRSTYLRCMQAAVEPKELWVGRAAYESLKETVNFDAQLRTFAGIPIIIKDGLADDGAYFVTVRNEFAAVQKMMARPSVTTEVIVDAAKVPSVPDASE